MVSAEVAGAQGLRFAANTTEPPPYWRRCSSVRARPLGRGRDTVPQARAHRRQRRAERCLAPSCRAARMTATEGRRTLAVRATA